MTEAGRRQPAPHDRPDELPIMHAIERNARRYTIVVALAALLLGCPRPRSGPIRHGSRLRRRDPRRTWTSIAIGSSRLTTGSVPTSD